MLACGAAGESRKRINIRAPGIFQTVGNSSGIQQFQLFSTALGSLQPTGGTAGPLAASLAGSGFGIPGRASAGGAAPGGGGGLLDLAPGATGNTRVYAPVFGGIEPATGGTPLAAAIQDGGEGEGPWAAAQAYVAMIGKGSEIKAENGSKPITSLVPAEPSRYRDYMARGEALFREGNFRPAFRQFQMANDIGGDDPESLLSMGQTRFALTTYSYRSASYYLRQALRNFPELPLVPLRPSEFYGDRRTYVQHIGDLRDFLREDPASPDGQFVKAYFYWFSGTARAADAAAETDPEVARRELADAKEDIAAARDALAHAIVLTKRRDIVEAVETFWAGMVASGHVQGELEPAKLEPLVPQPTGAEASAALPAANAASATREPPRRHTP